MLPCACTPFARRMHAVQRCAAVLGRWGCPRRCVPPELHPSYTQAQTVSLHNVHSLFSSFFHSPPALDAYEVRVLDSVILLTISRCKCVRAATLYWVACHSST